MPQPPKKQNWLRDLAPRDATKTKVDAGKDAAERARRALDAATRRMPAAPTMRANTKTDRLASDLARRQQASTQAMAGLMMNPAAIGAALTPGADAADAITSTLSSVKNAAKGNLKQSAKDAGWAALGALGVASEAKAVKRASAAQKAIGAADAERKLRRGLTERFVILTPDNPQGQIVDEATNAAARQRFEARLKELGINYRSGVGGYPGEGGRPLREQSYLLDTDLDTAKQLGREFDQAGVLSERGYHNLGDNTIYPSRGVQAGDPVPVDDGPTRVVGAALRAKNGKVYLGADHASALDEAEAAGADIDIDNAANHGFYTSDGRFVDRAEAAKLMGKNGALDSWKTNNDRFLYGDADDPTTLSPNDRRNVEKLGRGALVDEAWAAEDALKARAKQRRDAVFTKIDGFGDDAGTTGFKLDLDWDARQPDAAIANWTPEQLDAYGAAYGVEGLGRVSPPTEITLASGKKANIPGGFDGEWSYYDLLTLKAQGINPNDMPRDMHDMFQEKLGRSMQVADGGDDADVFRGLLLGITSPNSPLTPNEFTVSALMPRNMQDIEALSKMSGDEIVSKFRLDAGEKGGMGTRGTADYNNVANLARLFVQKPEWFRRRVNEDWSQFVERLSTQVRGLSPKTASFGAVWQDILNADISAIDRHMSDVFYKDIMSDPATRAAFEEQVIDAFNTGKTKWGGEGARPQVRSIDELRATPGGESAFKDAMMNVITKHSERSMTGRNAASLPPHLRDEQYIEPPKKAVIGGEAWRRALDANRVDAQEHGLSTFLSQWLLWDRMRGRLEPHEVMYPGLNKLPRMTHDQRRAALDVHKKAGYIEPPKKAGTRNTGINGEDLNEEEGMLRPARPVKNPMSMAYWSALAAAGLGGLMGPDEEPE